MNQYNTFSHCLYTESIRRIHCACAHLCCVVDRDGVYTHLHAHVQWRASPSQSPDEAEEAEEAEEKYSQTFLIINATNLSAHIPSNKKSIPNHTYMMNINISSTQSSSDRVGVEPRGRAVVAAVALVWNAGLEVRTLQPLRSIR